MPVPGLSLLLGIKDLEDFPEFNGYASSATWNLGKDNIDFEFRAKWEVPPPPANPSNQLLYLFNSITPNSDAILQPVLQWYDGSWSISCWYVRSRPDGSNDVSARTKQVAVNAGDSVVGLITQTKQEDGSVFCTCEFEGIPDTTLIVETPYRFITAGISFEIYNVTHFNELPLVDHTTFQSIKITSSGAQLKPEWKIDDYATELHIYANKVSDDRIDICYR